MGALNFCEGCGIQINSDSRFCKSCGKKMTEKTPIPETPKVLDPFFGNNEKTAPSNESYTQVGTLGRDANLDHETPKVRDPFSGNNEKTAPSNESYTQMDTFGRDTNLDHETSKVRDPFSDNNEKTAPSDESYIQAADEHLDYLSTDINSEPFQDPSVDDFSQNEKPPHPAPENTSNTTEPISAFKALRKIAKVLFISIVSILACVSGIIIILFWLLYSWVENQNSGIRNQLEALRTGKIEKAYSYMSKDFRANTQLDSFSMFLNEHPQLMANESQSFITNSQSGDSGKVIAKLKSKGGVETQVEYHLKKEDGEWKIVSIKVLP